MNKIKALGFLISLITGLSQVAYADGSGPRSTPQPSGATHRGRSLSSFGLPLDLPEGPQGSLNETLPILDHHPIQTSNNRSEAISTVSNPTAEDFLMRPEAGPGIEGTFYTENTTLALGNESLSFKQSPLYTDTPVVFVRFPTYCPK